VRRPPLQRIRIVVERLVRGTPADCPAAELGPRLPAARRASPHHQPRAGNLARIEPRRSRPAADRLEQRDLHALVERRAELERPVVTDPPPPHRLEPHPPVGALEIRHERLEERLLAARHDQVRERPACGRIE
jgi:hypothetical protein